MTSIAVILVALVILTSIPALYLLVSTMASFFFRKHKPDTNHFLNIGVLIPAHNEGASVKKTIESVLRCDYPANRFEVFVIADNCSDDTAAYARSAGATVFERFDPDNRGKGQALDWFLKRHKDRYSNLDAMTIIDADVTPDINYLREISASFSVPGTRVVQGYNGVNNPSAGWRPALIDAAFNVFNHLRLAASSVLTGSASLKGNGMAFKISVLEQYGWPCHSIVEDLEFTLRLLQDGIPVEYNPDAVITSEMVTTSKNATSQRSRWEGGRFGLVKSMTAPLLRQFISTGRIKFLYAWADLALPPLGLLVLLFIPGTIAGILLGKFWVWVSASYWMITLWYFIAGQIQRKAPLATWLSLFAAPLYVLWKIPIYLKMAVRKKGEEWVRTTREPLENK
ncbi:glycosyltransferase family 2 protein [Prosthecochloris sp. CIB 2401]|uniref:glycosyltransferase family 2 protein n=1 Tax=Prosthecochloris sp. CIB 2401 TaxID=1868325 RepID=UPI00080A9BE9|nr:glycosyltransferase family 2 protein [Prosthecochloris sp. CIB 2401]ANT64914.1 Poly-beta-1,6-N-acetyl-D-glucosamine synthase [Prosthecochloris sp. CIB 2401]